MMQSGWFTIGTVTFLTENERKDGKGSFLSIYVRFGEAKGEVRKAKVWSQNYLAEDGKVYLKDVAGAWGLVELGSELTAYGTEGSFTDAEGHIRPSYVLTESAGLPARVVQTESAES